MTCGEPYEKAPDVTDATAKMPPLDGPITHTHIGGQAVLEGIMMRGKYNWAVAVRTPDGSIHFEEHDLESGKAKKEWMRWPIVRGCVAMVEERRWRSRTRKFGTGPRPR